MSDPIGRLSRDELLAAAKAKGLDLTPDRLHRWRDEGLMPTPEVRSLGHALGRSSSYPVIALHQALMIGELLKRSRDFDLVRWRLFLDGFSVSLPKLRAQLRNLAAGQVAKREMVQSGVETEDDAEAERFERLAASAIDASSPLLRYARKQMRPVGRSTGAVIALQVASGLLSGAPVSKEQGDLLAALTNGLDVPDPSALIAPASAFVDPVEGLAALDATSDAALLDARREFLFSVLPLVQVAIDLLIVAVPGFGAALAAEAATDPYWPLPEFFLLWLRFRRHPDTPEVLAQLRALFETAARSHD
jgi:hypothetical protein